MKFLLSLLALTNAQLITWGGKCPTIPLIKDLDAQAYSGAWFEQARVPDKNQGDDRCVSPIYGVKDERNISVSNFGVVRVSLTVSGVNPELPKKFSWKKYQVKTHTSQNFLEKNPLG